MIETREGRAQNAVRPLFRAGGGCQRCPHWQALAAAAAAVVVVILLISGRLAAGGVVVVLLVGGGGEVSLFDSSQYL